MVHLTLGKVADFTLMENWYRKAQAEEDARRPGDPEPVPSTMEDLLDMATRQEALEMTTGTHAKKKDHPSAVTKVVKGKPNPDQKNDHPHITCFTCGRQGHYRGACKVVDPKCSYCKESGHLEAACQQKKKKEGGDTSKSDSAKKDKQGRQRDSKAREKEKAKEKKDHDKKRSDKTERHRARTA